MIALIHTPETFGPDEQGPEWGQKPEAADADIELPLSADSGPPQKTTTWLVSTRRGPSFIFPMLSPLGAILA